MLLLSLRPEDYVEVVKGNAGIKETKLELSREGLADPRH